MTATTAEKKHIADLHFEHKLWVNQLKFYKDEIVIFNNRLGEISQRYTDKGILAQLEHLQNQYIRQNEVVDELTHKINEHEQGLEKEAMDHPVAIDHRLFNDHTSLRDEMEQFVKIYNELKSELMTYLSKWM